MALPEYYLGVMDIVLHIDKDGMLHATCDELNINVGFNTGRLRDGMKSSIMIPAFKRRDNASYLCTTELIELLKRMQEEPDLVDKIEAVTAAHKALEDN